MTIHFQMFLVEFIRQKKCFSNKKKMRSVGVLFRSEWKEIEISRKKQKIPESSALDDKLGIFPELLQRNGVLGPSRFFGSSCFMSFSIYDTILQSREA